MNKEEQPKISKKSLLITIFSLLAVIITGTFAWLTWRSNNTAMVLRIGDVSGLTVTLKPYKINATLSPVASYTSNENVVVVDVTAQNNGTQFYTFNLFYQIDTIDSALIDEGFKYTITKCTANCDTASNYSLLNDDSGNFSTASSNSNFNIYEEAIPGMVTYKYKVYLWIDSSAGNQTNMQSKSFIGELRARVSGEQTVYTVNLYDANATGWNSVWQGQPISNSITQYNTPEAAITALEAAYSNANSGATTSLSFFLKHTVADGTLWCANEYDNGVVNGNSFCAFPSQAACNSRISEWEYDNITYTCVENTFTGGVSESYVGFVVTPDMATANPGMVAGTYYLRGGDNGASFVDNAKTIYDAFGGVGCYLDGNSGGNPYTTTPSSNFNCSVSGLRAGANSNGNVYAVDNAGSYCIVDSYGVSNCEVYVGGGGHDE